MKLLCLATFLCLCTVYQVNSSRIEFQTSSPVIMPLMTSNLNMSCRLPDTQVVKRSEPSLAGELSSEDLKKRALTKTDDDMVEVAQILISKEGEDIIAFVTQHEEAGSTVADPGFLVSGQVKGVAAGEAFLELVWPHPGAAEAGSYSCEIYARKTNQRIKSFKKSLSLSEKKVIYTDLIAYLQEGELEKEALQQTIEDLQRDQAKINEDQTKINEDQAKINQQVNQSVTDLSRKVFFTAIASGGWVEIGKSLKYQSPLTNEGSAFDANTGIFTAPYTGFYHFELHILSDNDDAYVNIEKNGVKVASVLVMSDDSYRGSSNSVNLRLDQGDTVSAVASARSWVHSGTGDGQRSSFSGHLVALA